MICRPIWASIPSRCSNTSSHRIGRTSSSAAPILWSAWRRSWRAVAPAVPIERLIEYWFVKDATFDDTLLSDLAALRAGGTALHLATDQEHRRADYLWTKLDLRSRFDAMHYAAALGAQKASPAFFAAVTARAALCPAEIGFIDDFAPNIEAARAAGWCGYVWTSCNRGRRRHFGGILSLARERELA